MSNHRLYYKRKLPHQQPPGAIIFITAGLSGSMPATVQTKLQQDAAQLKNTLRNLPGDAPELVAAWKKLFRFVDTELDRSEKAYYLKNPAVASVVLSSLNQLVSEGMCILHRYCIMPNHIHILIEPLPQNVGYSDSFLNALPAWPPLFYSDEVRHELEKRMPLEKVTWYSLSDIMKSIKGSTAHKIARLVNTNGKIWMQESYDHWIRNSGEYERVIDYIDFNPVKAGLCSSPENWEFSSAGIGAEKPAFRDNY